MHGKIYMFQHFCKFWNKNLKSQKSRSRMDVFVLLKKEYFKKSHAAVPLNMEDVTFYLHIDIFRYQKIETCPVVLTYSKLSET